MANNPEKPLENKEQPILTLIQQVKDGHLDAETIDKDQRLLCVEVLLGEGCSVATMAQIFKKCEKTIRRDIDEIRDCNAISPNVDLAKKIVGELLTYSRIHRDHLMRLARIKDASVSERSQAEYLAARVGMELIQKMQSLGYLPVKPAVVVGDVFHHFDAKDADGAMTEISEQVAELEKIISDGGPLPDVVKKELIEVKGFVKKAEEIKKKTNKEEA